MGPKYRDDETIQDASAQTINLHRVAEHRGQPPEAAQPAPEDPLQNVLRIRSGSFALELEGDPDFINNVYAAVRRDVLERLMQTVTGAQGPTGAFDDDPDTLVPGAEADTGGGSLWLYVCHRYYRKIHVVSRDALRASPVANLVNFGAISKIYVDREEIDDVGGLIDTGKTLWSELTPAGKAKMAPMKS